MSNQTSSLGAWWVAMRPKTLPAAVAPVILGSALAWWETRSFFFLPFVMIVLCALLLQGVSNLVNDLSDYESGLDTTERLGPTRATQSGLATPQQMKRFITGTVLLTLLLGLYLVLRGGWPILCIGLLAIGSALWYSKGFFSFAPLSHSPLADIFVLFFFGPIATAGTYYLQSGLASPTALCIGVSPGLFAVAILAVNNTRDQAHDKAAGRRTLPILLGDKGARVYYAIVLFAATLFPVLLLKNALLPLGTLLGLLALPPAFLLSRAFLSGLEGKTLNKLLARTAQLLLFHSLLLAGALTCFS